MFDEEVQFKLIRNAPRSKIGKSLENTIEALSIAGGGIAGFLGVKYGLEFGNFWSTIFGFGGGALLTAYVFDKVTSPIHNFCQGRYDKRQIKLDQVAKENDAEVVNFRYRRNLIECVIRPEYQNAGHIFYMSINDGVVSNPTFSYQPDTNKLAFRFDIPNFKEDSASESLDKQLRKISQDMLNGSWVETPTRISSKEDLEKLYLELVKGFVNNEEGNFQVKFEKYGKVIRTILTYIGDDYDKKGLIRFPYVANNLMKKSYNFRVQSKF